MSTIAESLANATRKLTACSDSPRLDAELLLGSVVERNRAGLIVDGDESLDPACERAYAELVAERLAGMPVAYLTGRREFWSLELRVTPAVLVPRPETETLVEAVLDCLPASRHCAVLDLGTGSGAIAIAIAKERPRARVTGTDLSMSALEVATGNAENLGFAAIEWCHGSWFDAVRGRRFDAIVANPPYVAAGDAALAALKAEPLLALTPGASGLEAIESIIAAAADHLREHGLLALEHGSGQASEVAALLERHGFINIRSRADRSGLPRVTLANSHSHPKVPS
ncbi:MAG TPA: peptide chain release factor N(5)-glutamine methyltransferase [Steroidobacteraceae bacterium]|nr:peptide chain release factor N(5)-glutamine methyltransferase [Steroidobacteraceae bacterium]